MPHNAFAHVRDWVFDLDNTLYPADCNLFHQIDARMTDYIVQFLGVEWPTARRLQKDYYVQYGTTLSGLMQKHDVSPTDFMDYVHDIDISPVKRDDALVAAIKALPGRRYIFTNGSIKHAENVAGAIGVLDLFDGVFDIANGGFTPKPHAAAYDRFHAHFDIDPVRAAMFEDMPENLQVPHSAGVRTVLVQSTAAWFDDEPEEKRPARPGQRFSHVDHVTSDLTAFLHEITPPCLT